MQFIQTLNFEVTRGCQLAGKHPECPINDRERWDLVDASQPMTDDQVVECCRHAYAMGFRGLVQWHYYSEPTVDFPRVQQLAQAVRAAVPLIRIGLYTNGRGLPDDPKEIRWFDRVQIRRYPGDDKDWSHLVANHPDCRVERAWLDGRLTVDPVDFCRKRCRTATQFILDYFGNVHLCFGDWRCEATIGNLHQVAFRELAHRFITIRDKIAQDPMPESSPRACLRCGKPCRDEMCAIDVGIFNAGLKHFG